MRAALLLTLACAACSPAPSRVRIQIGLAADAQAMASGPALLDVYGLRGRVFQNRSLEGKLPGDVVVLLDDDIGEARAWVRVVRSDGVAAGTGRATLRRGQETRIVITLSTMPLGDGDTDGVPDDIDDCPGIADPLQNGMCGDGDLALPAFDLGFADDLGSMPVDMTANPCGNGMMDGTEQCDDGANNSDDPAKVATCTTQCKKRAPCGALAGSTSSAIDPATGHCYVVWPTAVPWATAERDCLTRGAHLTAITSNGENNAVKALSNVATWIGMLSSGLQNTWSTGETSAFKDFRGGEPSQGAQGCVVMLDNGNWENRACGYPAAGLLPASPASALPYICEHGCGNGVLEAGEECDPPGAACTIACRKPRACTEAGGVVSPASGFCYFATAVAVTYANALNGSCPAGTHLATPNGPRETETAILAITTDSWIAVVAPATAGVFQYDVAGPTLQPARYHGFLTPDPDQATPPVSAVISKNLGQADAWRDRVQTATYPAICQRDQ